MQGGKRRRAPRVAPGAWIAEGAPEPWLKKAVDAVDADPYALHADDAMVRLGVGKNMVSSIRHWGLATGMLAEGSARRGSRSRPLAPTDLGRLLFLDGGWDPFLEDPGTLWLLHWQLASRPEPATTWWWVFNQYPGTIFSAPRVERAETSTRCVPTFIDEAMASGATPPTCSARPGTVGRNAGSTTPDVLL